MATFLSTLAAESKDLLRRAGFGRPGGGRGIVLHLAVVLTFGVFVPWWKGLAFMDPLILVAYVSLALVFAAPAAAELLAGGAEIASATLLYARVGAAVLYGWVVAVVIVGLGMGTVNLVERHGVLLHPPWSVLGAALLAGLMAALLVGLVTAVLTLLFSAVAAKTVMRLFFLFLLAFLLIGWGRLPLSWRDAMENQMTSDGILRLSLAGSAVLLVLDAALAVLLRAPFLDRR